jgi:hypothetical protein
MTMICAVVHQVPAACKLLQQMAGGMTLHDQGAVHHDLSGAAAAAATADYYKPRQLAHVLTPLWQGCATVIIQSYYSAVTASNNAHAPAACALACHALSAGPLATKVFYSDST